MGSMLVDRTLVSSGRLLATGTFVVKSEKKTIYFFIFQLVFIALNVVIGNIRYKLKTTLDLFLFQL